MRNNNKGVVSQHYGESAYMSLLALMNQLFDCVDERLVV
jgi:hypothetical protein